MTTPTHAKPLTIAIVAGEISGDMLGASFMQAMNALAPNIHWLGVGGEKMHKQGLSSIIDMNRLAVMGLAEVVKQLPNLLIAKRQILAHFAQHDIDIFVGIDAPDFNLRLGKKLKAQGIFCVQYVSPSIWAWREGRIFHIKSATDLVLCLFPFELNVYHKHNHPAVCVGHPLTAQLKQATWQDKAFYRQQLLAHHKQDATIALLAGSRQTEIWQNLPLLLGGFAKLQQSLPKAQAILALADDKHYPLIGQLIDQHTPKLKKHIHIKQPKDWQNHGISLSQAVMTACDIVLLASGTATLECMLIATPMVVVYQVNPITYHIAKKLIKTPFVALPNIINHHRNPCLNPSPIVPELLQHNATADNIAKHAQHILTNPAIQQRKLSDTSDWLIQQSQHNPALAVLDAYQQKINTQTQSINN